MAKKTLKDFHQIEEENVVRQLKELRSGFIPEPTRFFKVGDKVLIGHLDNIVVLEVLDEGKIIKVRYDRLKEEGYRDPSSFNHKGYWIWVDVFPFRNNEENKKIKSFKTSILDMHRKFNFYQQEINSLVFKHYKWGVEMDTEYQRPLVWTIEEKRMLIESMFKNVDIGKFVFIKREYNENPKVKSYEVLDGKQRLSTIMEYFEDRFTFKGKKLYR